MNHFFERLEYLIDKIPSNKEQTMNLEMLEKELGKGVEYEKEFRFEECPFNGCLHDNNPSFSVDKETGQCYCHDCKEGGQISQFVPEIPKGDTPPPQEEKVEEYDDKAQKYYDSLTSAAKDSLTGKYLENRGIFYSTWSDLTYHIKENLGDEINKIAIYPFVDKQSRIVATQSVFIARDDIYDKERRYFGKKSQGVAILKDAPKVIVAEGLETGLSVKQYLGSEYGLIICGDAGNMISLAHENSWALKDRKKIIIAADNDINNVGINAAREVFYEFYKKALIYLPDQPGSDWNDVLVQNQFKEQWL